MFLSAGFALWGEILFFAPPKKSNQKKRGPGGLPAARVPCASREARRLRNSRSRDARLAQTGRKRHPVFTAMLGCANGLKIKGNTQIQKAPSFPRRRESSSWLNENHWIPGLRYASPGMTVLSVPSALTEYRRQSGTRGAAIRAQRVLRSP